MGNKFVKPVTLWVSFAAGFAVLLTLDFLLKIWAEANLASQPAREIIPGILGFTFHRNPGAAFGFLADWQHSRWFFLGVNVLLLVALTWYYSILPRTRRFWWMRVPIIFIVAGGAGNVLCRIIAYEGRVRDMLEFLFVNFAIFNLADVFIVSGVIALLFAVIFVIRDVPLFN
jgi:signal peptidase II